MKIRILKEFRDKYQPLKTYMVGEEIKGFDKSRVSDLVKRGLAEVIEGTKSNTPATTRTTKKAALNLDPAKNEKIR